MCADKNIDCVTNLPNRLVIGRFEPDIQIDVNEWVILNAYLANLDALNFYGGRGESQYGCTTMAYALKHTGGLQTYYRDPEDELYGPTQPGRECPRCCTVDLVERTELRRYAVYPRLSAGSTTSNQDYFNLESTGASVESWEIWKRGFEAASNDESLWEDVQGASAKAFALMNTLEVAMPA
jgi:hypothetical protein